MTDAASVALNPAAPAAERTEALSVLQQSHLPTESQMLAPEVVRDLITDAEAFYAQEAFEKSIDPNRVPYPFGAPSERPNAK